MGCSWPSFSSPSTVVISAPSACTASTVHDFTALPFSSTVHAPQYVVSQPTCVPVRSRSSRSNSTSSLRGSIWSSCGLPLTRILMATLSIASGIKMTHLHLFAAGPAPCDLDGSLDQRPRQPALIVRGAAHVGLRIGRGLCRFHRRDKGFWRDGLPAKSALRVLRPDRRQAYTTQENRRLLAGVTLHDQLYRGTRRGVHRRRTLKCDIGPAAALGRIPHNHFAEQLIVPQRGGVGILDELRQGHRPFALRAQAAHFSGEGQQHGCPVAAWVSLRQRPPDGPPIAYLHIGDTRRTVMNNGNTGGSLRALDFRVPGQGAKSQAPVLLLDVGDPGNKVEINQVSGIGEAQLHQGNQALPARQRLGFLAQFRQHGAGLLERTGAVIVKCSGIHSSVLPCPPIRRAGPPV